ncbi:MAG: formylglycine-generating enzyme family protein [Deltaproteobacteria bacterium]|nr:formylglycine-generating enzyme family protein [Deltaproteobacteria bacterium]
MDRIRIVLIILMGAGMLLAGSCKRREAVPVAEPSPTPPPMDVLPQIWGSADETMTWQRGLANYLKDDLRWRLEPRDPDFSAMVRLLGGETTVGCPGGGPDGSCLTERRVTVEGFYIDRHETTNAEYAVCVKERKCVPPTPAGHMPDWDAPKRPVLVTVKMAERYCLWSGKRLPTEYEWELAARGLEGRPYPWGDDEPTATRGNVCGGGCPMPWAVATWDDGYAFTSPVGSFPAGDTADGLTDMASNVKEWVRSNEPLGENEFINRGASWYSPVDQMDGHTRQVWRPGVRLDDKGVRCAADVPQEE